MKNRITRDQLNMDIARLISKRSTCGRGHVGAVITTSEGRVISTGYNGPMKHDFDCHSHLKPCDKTKSCQRAIHAEANAIYHAARKGISLEDCILYSTHKPCRKCCEAIVQSGIVKVWYMHDYTSDHRSSDESDSDFISSGVSICRISDYDSSINEE